MIIISIITIMNTLKYNLKVTYIKTIHRHKYVISNVSFLPKRITFSEFARLLMCIL